MIQLPVDRFFLLEEKIKEVQINNLFARSVIVAELTCRKLIDYCLERDLIPVWSCRFENTASCKLAQKLGFEPTLMIPFYRLSN